jgi:hypothetical protein
MDSLIFNKNIVMQWFAFKTIDGSERVAICITIFKENKNPKLVCRTSNTRPVMAIPSLASLDLEGDFLGDSIIELENNTYCQNNFRTYLDDVSLDDSLFLKKYDVPTLAPLVQKDSKGKQIWETTFLSLQKLTFTEEQLQNTMDSIQTLLLKNHNDVNKVSYGTFITMLYLVNKKLQEAGTVVSDLKKTTLERDCAIYIKSQLYRIDFDNCIGFRGPVIREVWPFIVASTFPLKPPKKTENKIVKFANDVTIEYTIIPIGSTKLSEEQIQFYKKCNTNPHPCFPIFYGAFTKSEKTYICIESDTSIDTLTSIGISEIRSLAYGIQHIRKIYGSYTIPFDVSIDLVDFKICSNGQPFSFTDDKGCWEGDIICRFKLIPTLSTINCARVYLTKLASWLGVMGLTPEQNETILYEDWVKPFVNLTFAEWEDFANDLFSFNRDLDLNDEFASHNFYTSRYCTGKSFQIVHPQKEPSVTFNSLADWEARSANEKRSNILNILETPDFSGNKKMLKLHLNALANLTEERLTAVCFDKLDLDALSILEVESRVQDVDFMFCLFQTLIKTVTEKDLDSILNLSVPYPPILTVLFKAYVRVLSTLNYDASNNDFSSVFGIATALGWKNGTKPIAVMKVSYDKAMPLIHEVVVGMVVSKLQSSCFMNIFGGAMCSLPMKDNFKTKSEPKTDALCGSSFDNEMLVFSDFVQSSGSLSSMMTKLSRPDLLKLIITLIFELQKAGKKFGFIHNDLHFNNILVRPTNREYKVIVSDGNILKYTLNYEPVVIDYGYSCVEIDGEQIVPLRYNINLHNDTYLSGQSVFCSDELITLQSDPEECYLRQFSIITAKPEDRCYGYDLLQMFEAFMTPYYKKFVPESWITTYRTCLGWALDEVPDTVYFGYPTHSYILNGTDKNLKAARLRLDDPQLKPLFSDLELTLILECGAQYDISPLNLSSTAGFP